MVRNSFKTELRPRWGEVDEDRVLRFPVVFRYFKDMEARSYRSLGICVVTTGRPVLRFPWPPAAGSAR